MSAMRIIENQTKTILTKIFSKTKENPVDVENFIIASNPKALKVKLIHTKQSNVGWFYTLEVGML